MYKFSENPGAFERHFIRQNNNKALFENADLSADSLKAQQAQDEKDVNDFQINLAALVQRAVDLEKQTDSQILLDLKSELEQAYTYACSLAGNQEQNKKALNQLIQVFIATINNQIGQDTLAINEMKMEKEAREIHFKMIENPLIADLLRENSPIPQDRLVETLLSETIDSCFQCLSLFQDEQIISLIESGLIIETRLSKNKQWTDQYQNNISNMGQIIKNIAQQ